MITIPTFKTPLFLVSRAICSSLSIHAMLYGLVNNKIGDKNRRIIVNVDICSRFICYKSGSVMDGIPRF